MDVADLDFGCRFILGRERLALQPMEQGRLADVLLAFNHHAHCERSENRRLHRRQRAVTIVNQNGDDFHGQSSQDRGENGYSGSRRWLISFSPPTGLPQCWDGEEIDHDSSDSGGVGTTARGRASDGWRAKFVRS